MKILENVNPKDLKNFDIEQLRSLCVEIRENIVDAVINCGGHLSSSLGAVEIITALHHVFDFPKDKLIFDVGHQAYAHKLITGRVYGFCDKLRKLDGIGAFLKRSESEYDTFTTGHAGVSVSSALGLARARDLSGDDYEVVAVVGDSSLANGMAFEAMNDSGTRSTKHILVLNDNDMSISKAVGAISSRLTHLRQNRAYKKFKNTFKKTHPKRGEDFKFFKKVKDGIKYMFSTGVLFEEFGYKYIGPIDGHDLKALIEALKIAKNETKPVILHAVTKKGKGCIEAEKNPDIYHGIAPMYYEKAKNITYSHCLGSKLSAMCDSGKRLVGVCAGMPDGTGLKEFSKKHPDSFFDVGIAEEHAITMASGIARGGVKPYVAIYSTFMQRAVDSIIHDVVLQDLPVTICIDRAGIVGEDGETHQGIFDVALTSVIPNIAILSPASIEQFEKMLDWSYDYGHPLIIRYPRGTVDNAQFANFDFGKWDSFGEGGVTIVASGASMVNECLRARELLKNHGIDAKVVNASTLKPIDERLLVDIADTSVFVVEDNLAKGGLGSIVREFYSTKDIKTRVVSIAIDDVFVTQGKIGELQDRYGVSSDKIAEKILKYSQNNQI